jgi:hypothetical protein
MYYRSVCTAKEWHPITGGCSILFGGLTVGKSAPEWFKRRARAYTVVLPRFEVLCPSAVRTEEHLVSNYVITCSMLAFRVTYAIHLRWTLNTFLKDAQTVAFSVSCLGTGSILLTCIGLWAAVMGVVGGIVPILGLTAYFACHGLDSMACTLVASGREEYLLWLREV